MCSYLGGKIWKVPPTSQVLRREEPFSKRRCVANRTRSWREPERGVRTGSGSTLPGAQLQGSLQSHHLSSRGTAFFLCKVGRWVLLSGFCHLSPFLPFPHPPPFYIMPPLLSCHEVQFLKEKNPTFVATCNPLVSLDLVPEFMEL